MYRFSSHCSSQKNVTIFFFLRKILMINSPFALEVSCLYFYYFTKPNPIQPPSITLQLLENEASNIQTNTLPMDYISYYLHILYRYLDIQGKAAILRIICQLEINSDIPLIEKYKFDDLVCESFQRQIPEQQSKSSDDEKVSAFKYVAFLIQGKQIFPESIIRALIFLFNMPKSNFGKLIVNLFAKGLLLCDNFPDIPEVANILVDTALSKPEGELIDLFGYIFERKCNRPLQKIISYRLIAPFSVPGKNNPRLENATKISIELLRTWPGVFCLGLSNEVIADFFKTIKSITPTILKILDELLLIDGPDESIVDTYTGFIFYNLLQSGILEKLDELALTNEKAAKFINSLLKYIPYEFCSINSKINLPKTIVDYSSTEKIIDSISQNNSDTQFPTQISTYVLPNDKKNWDWPTIRSFLTLILPSNLYDVTSESAVSFYKSLLDYYGSQFLFDNGAVFNPVIAQCLEALFDILLRPFLKLTRVLSDQNGHNLPIAIIGSFQKIFKSSEKSSTSEYHPAWSLIQLFLRLMADQNGIQVLTMWNSYSEVKKYIDNNVNDLIPAYAKRLLNMVIFSEIPSLSANFFLSFMNSSNLEIVTIAMDELENKAKSSPYFYKFYIEPVLFNYMKKINQQKKTANINIVLNLLCKLMLSSNECLQCVCKDATIREIIRSNSHEIYSIIFSVPNLEQPTESNKNTNQQNTVQFQPSSTVDSEISYWMESGIFKYVSTYDTAISMTFKKETKTTVPSIIVSNGFALIPPHLFSQLSKTEEGLKKLQNCLPRLIHLLDSNHISKRRAALFALGHLGSVNNGISTDIITKMITSVTESNSYLLRGTLLVSFSIMKPNNVLSNFIYKSGYQLFKFGPHSCVVPNELGTMLFQIKQQFYDSADVESAKPFNRPQNLFTSTVINCIYSRIPQPKIDLQNMVTTKRKEIATLENSQFLRNLMANFALPNDLRSYLNSIVSIMPPTLPHCTDKVDTKTFQITYAKIYEASLSSQIPVDGATIENIQLNQYPLSQVKSLKADSPCPEVYLNDEDFKTATGYDRDSFYKLQFAQINAIRENFKRQ